MAESRKARQERITAEREAAGIPELEARFRAALTGAGVDISALYGLALTGGGGHRTTATLTVVGDEVVSLIEALERAPQGPTIPQAEHDEDRV